VAEEVPVLIVGGGPVGLGLAVELGLRGVQCLLVEQGDGTIDYPRANTVNSRTMEFCRRWGIAEEVRNAGAPPDFPPTIVYATGLQGHLLTKIERPTHGGARSLPTTPEPSQRCNQLWFDPIMRRLVSKCSPVTQRYKCRLESFEEKSDHVLATVRNLDTGKSETIATKFLVACCGGKSPIPKVLGVSMEGEPVISYHLTFFLRIPQLWNHHDKGKAAFYHFISEELEGDGTSLIELDGNELWRLTLTDTRKPIDPGAVRIDQVMAKLAGPGVPFKVVSSLPWICRSIVASRYGRDRVMLAGDAVHQNGPAGGFGMNTGMGDAVDLGWKLAATLQGWGGPGLLSSYEAERRPVALRVVREATDNMTSAFDPALTVGLEENSPDAEARRRKLGDDIQRSKTKQFISDGIALGYRYEGSPVICGDGTPAPPDSVMKYVPSSRPGGRAPHAWVSPGKSTIDLFGKGFVLLRFRKGADRDQAFVSAAQDRRVPFEIVDIESPEAAVLYGSRLVLVRPDGHVAWRGEDAPGDPLAVIDRVRGAAAVSPR
jgi:2-polyprenyl-6-methoxyphenol hydroxylase-like FAD-dependent oxidoreductase